MNANKLHITVEPGPHGEVVIIGEPSALKVLEGTLQNAVSPFGDGKETATGFFDSHGEGFEIHVRSVPAEDPYWETAVPPYLQAQPVTAHDAVQGLPDTDLRLREITFSIDTIRDGKDG